MVVILSRADLRAEGFSAREITEAVRDGRLIRARRDNYLIPGTADEIVRAVRVGGRLTCLSLLQVMGVFVLTGGSLHVHVPENVARLRSPHDRARRLEPRSRRGVTLHWARLAADPGAESTVGIVDALAHAVRCQSTRAAVATLDSALHRGIIALEDLHEVFRLLPSRFSVLAPLVDARSESGPETLVRLILRAIGCVWRIQVQIDAVGRVDFLVDGWLIIECDSVEHHATPEQYEKDRERDARAAAQGYSTLRLAAKTIMRRPDVVREAIEGLLSRRR